MSLSTLQRLYRTGLIAAALLCTAEMVSASAADRRLEAIKQALIDLSLGSELQLSASAYVDARGVLHESSLVTSQSQVRGVRVLSYLEEAGISTASLDAIVAASECAISRPDLRRQVLVNVDYGEGNPRLGDHYMSEVAALSQQSVVAALSESASWAVVEQQSFSSRYHQKMAASNNLQPPLELQVALGEALPRRASRAQINQYLSNQSASALYQTGSKIAALSDRQSWPSQTLAWSLRLIDPVLGQVILTENGRINYPSQDRGYSKSYLPGRFVSELSTLSQRFVAAAEDVLQCSPRYYHVSRSGRHGSFSGQPVSGTHSDTSKQALEFKINGGRVAGVQIGDQFLLSRTPQITGEGARLHDIETLVLAEVQEVNRHSAMLRPIAGQQRPNTAAESRSGNNLSNYVAIYF
jgi:hypothetical protein